MKKRRIIITILIILFIIFALMLGLWFLARKQAEKKGFTPPTFRSFFSPGIPITPIPPDNGELSSDFTPETGATDPGDISPRGDGTQTSQFTTTTIIPAGVSGSSSTNTASGAGGTTSTGSGQNGTTAPGSNTTTTNTNTTENGTVFAPPLDLLTENACSTADTTIDFTTEELVQLEALEKRFYAIAQTLHTDADNATEIANYDAFKTRYDRVTELHQYCVAQMQKIKNPVLLRKVPTPFWNENSLASGAYITDYAGQQQSGGNSSGTFNIFGGGPSLFSLFGSGPGRGSTDLNNINSGMSTLERFLRLNLW